MKLDIAKKWIEALRSGKYKKTIGALKKVGNNEKCSFCALGVLCDIYQKESDSPLLELKRKNSDKKVSMGGQYYILPDEVRKWAGMRSLSGGTPMGDIPQLNDGCDAGQIHKRSFKEIADIIEKNMEEI